MYEEDTTRSQDPLVCLATYAINVYVSEGRVIEAEPRPEFEVRAACFVSIYTTSTGDLRGCIGTISPSYENLGLEIVHNALAAATQDPRFQPIRERELNDLTITVDVLSESEPATIEDLDPKRYGVIVTQGYKRGLLLPDLEGVDTVREQLDIACRKAGIDPQSVFEIERFEVVRHT